MSASESQTPTVNSADAAAVRDLFRQLLDGWNGGSGDAFAAPFQTEADFIAFDGSHVKGRAEIAAVHQELFDKWLKGSRLVAEIKSIRFLSSEVALLHATGDTVLSGRDRPSKVRDSIQTLVAVKEGTDWKFAAFHNNRVRPIGTRLINIFIWMLTDRLWKFFGTGVRPSGGVREESAESGAAAAPAGRTGS